MRLTRNTPIPIRVSLSCGEVIEGRMNEQELADVLRSRDYRHARVDGRIGGRMVHFFDWNGAFRSIVPNRMPFFPKPCLLTLFCKETLTSVYSGALPVEMLLSLLATRIRLDALKVMQRIGRSAGEPGGWLWRIGPLAPLYHTGRETARFAIFLCRLTGFFAITFCRRRTFSFLPFFRLLVRLSWAENIQINVLNSWGSWLRNRKITLLEQEI